MSFNPSALLTRFNGFSIGARIVISAALGLLAIGLLVRLSGAAHELIFGNTEAKRERAGAVVVQEQGEAQKETGIEAGNEVVRTYEHHVEIDRVVKESQNAVNRADHGQEMDPEIDHAVAAGLCRVHDSLCRR